MTTREQILALVERRTGGDPKMKPIYEIVGCDDIMNCTVKNGEMPLVDLTRIQRMGFLHDLDDAIMVVETNWGDINEGGCFDSALILCRIPGMYRVLGEELRMYYVWDKDEKGYVQTEEPEIPLWNMCLVLN